MQEKKLALKNVYLGLSGAMVLLKGTRHNKSQAVKADTELCTGTILTEKTKTNIL